MSMNYVQGTGMWVLGDNFLHNYVAVFDYDNMRIGFIGRSSYEQIPTTTMQYLTYMVTLLLVLVIMFIVYQLCCQKAADGSSSIDELSQYQRMRGGTGNSD